LAENIPVFFGFPLGLTFFLANDEQSVKILVESVWRITSAGTSKFRRNVK